MATQVKHRRGTNAEVLAGTPAIGELWINTTTNRIHLGDGVTQGGIPHAKLSDIEGLGDDILDLQSDVQTLQSDVQTLQSDVTNINDDVQVLQDEVSNLNELVGQGVYGVVWNSEVDTYNRVGSSNYTQIQENMKRCVLNDDGTVNYYLSTYDSTLKADGVTPSVLDGTDGNVMVEIPKFYYKYTVEGTYRKIEISAVAEAGFTIHPAFIKAGVEVDYRYYRAYTGFVIDSKLRSVSGVTPTRSQTIALFRTQAELNGAGWHLTDWRLLDAIKMLYLVEYANFNSQSFLGNGNDTGTDHGITTGQSNSIGNASSGPNNDNTWMSYRGIENWYADCWEFIDGINIQNRLVYLNDNYNTFASDVFIGDYVSTGISLPVADSSYIRDLNFGDEGFIPTNVTGASSSTFITDGCWSDTVDRVFIHGGAADSGLLDGAFCSGAKDASSIASVTVGAAVSF